MTTKRSHPYTSPMKKAWHLRQDDGGSFVANTDLRGIALAAKGDSPIQHLIKLDLNA
ncbi:MAG: hypothetical protein ABJH33_19535 [Rhizobiaceae bacterium]